MSNATNIVREIGPSFEFAGKRALIIAIEETARLMEPNRMQSLLITKEVYPVVARRLGTNGRTVARGVARAADACWMEGENGRLNEIIGTRLLDRPKPKEIVEYCAYYLRYGVPYHKREDKPALSMIF